MSRNEIDSEFVATINSLEKTRGWNGPESKPISLAACRGALVFVEMVNRELSVLPLPEVSPSMRGGITLVWQFPGTSFLVRIFDENNSAYYQKEIESGFFVENGTENTQLILERLRGIQ